VDYYLGPRPTLTEPKPVAMMPNHRMKLSKRGTAVVFYSEPCSRAWQLMRGR